MASPVTLAVFMDEVCRATRRIRWRGLGVLGPALLLGAAGCGSSDAVTTGAVEQPIIGGTLDHEHTGVFSIVTHVQGATSLCTGTLIAPNLLLTARHCVSPGLSDQRFVICGESEFGDPYAGDDIIVTNEPVLNETASWYRGRAVRVPSEGNDTCGFDVALVILARNVPASEALVHVPRIDRVVESGEVYTAIGYGETEAAPGSEASSRMRRSGLTIQCQPGDCGAGATSSEFLGETGICSGDSGGPALDAEGLVVGVVSRGSEPCETPIYGAVSAWSDWMREVAVEAAGLGGYDPPPWALTGITTQPEPPPDAGADGGGPAGHDPQGSPCGPGAGCPSGYVCYYDRDPAAAHCTATCETGCGAGLECRADLGVCSAPAPAPGDSGGCAAAPAPAGRGTALALLALFAAFSARKRPFQALTRIGWSRGGSNP
ncbi:MAG TPA: S1 family peptidase [Polyangiaceae bacterium]|nr:S1 family peptidase [Polyangiaceae bacterium]